VITLHEIDASALGAAMIAMAGDPAAPRDLRAVVDEVVKTQTDRAFDPRHELADVYDGAYRRYRGAAEHLLAWVREADAT
jgi:sugar (pentulose or hexulose) kinase